MKKILIIFFCIIVQFSTLIAGNENNPIGGRSAALGNASVTFSDFWSIHNNQAGLAYFDNITAGFYYENRFGLSELSLKSGAFVLPTKSGVCGLSMNYFGYSQYNENKIGLAYAKSFGKKFSVGIQFDYLSTHIAENYGSKSLVTFEIGMIAKLTENLSIGTHFYNPISVKLNDYNDERVPYVGKLGLAYNFSDKVLLSVETEKETDIDPILKAGIEYRLIKEIYVRTGITTKPFVNTFGFGIKLKKLQFDFSSSLHPVLGYSPQISFIYNIK